MPHNIVFENLPAGIALTSARGGGTVKVAFKEFTSSEDGDLFIQRLEGFPSEILNKLPISVKASTVDHMLAIIKRDKSAIVYLNELSFIAKIRPKRAIKEKGEPIYRDDIAEIDELSFDNDVVIADEAGFIFVFSSGWRKGLFFDFGPLCNPPISRNYNLQRTLGHYLSYLEFQHLFKLTDIEWEKLFKQKWFPFISLRTSTVQKMLSFIRSDLLIDDLLGEIVSEVKSSTDVMLQRWNSAPSLSNHNELINHAVERYLNDDYISATSIIYTRIEGIMRDIFMKENVSERMSAKSLTKAVTAKKQTDDLGASLLLPNMFHKYLDDVYFLGFNPGQVAEISRNSVAHGVANSKDFSAKAVTIGLLIIDQLFFFLPSEKS